MIHWIDKKFKLKEHHTDIKTEFLAGITVFITMVYALATVPNMLEATGVDKHVLMTVMVLLIALRHLLWRFTRTVPLPWRRDSAVQELWPL